MCNISQEEGPSVVSFGTSHASTILLLHGGGLGWWNYREAAALLESRYHVVLPVLDGHGGSSTPFTSIEDNAAQIISYIETHLGGRVTLLGGLSLGGQVAAEILSQRPDICDYALLESTLVKPMRLTHALIGPTFGMSYGLIRHKWFSKLQVAYLGIPKALFDDYYRDTCRIRKEDMIAFLKANSSYRLKPSFSETSAKVMIAAGAREQRSILASAKLLHSALPGSTLEILPGMRHGDLSINHPRQFAEMIAAFIEEH